MALCFSHANLKKGSCFSNIILAGNSKKRFRMRVRLSNLHDITSSPLRQAQGSARHTMREREKSKRKMQMENVKFWLSLK